MPRSSALPAERRPVDGDLDLDLDDDDGGGGPLADPSHAAFCFSTLLHHFDGAGSSSSAPSPDFDHDGHHCPLFVTWDSVCPSSGSKSLRGCIGSLAPQPLLSGLRSYALTSALRDRRFPPVARSEVPALHCTVSLLRSFEEGLGWEDWVPGRHGIIIEFEEPDVEGREAAGGGSSLGGGGEGEKKSGGGGSSSSSRSLRSRLLGGGGNSSNSASSSSRSSSSHSSRSSPASVLSATYLPHVAPEQGWGVEEAIHSLIRKAGFGGKITGELKRELRLTRYESSMAGMGWREYQRERGEREKGERKAGAAGKG